VSAGLDIARRVGLAPRVVERARGYLGETAVRSEELLARLAARAAELELRLAELETRRAEEAEARMRLEHRLADEIERARATARQALDRALASFERDSRRAIAAIEELGASRSVGRAAARIAAGVRTRHRDLSGPWNGVEEAGRRRPERVEEGQTVLVGSLGRQGRVIGVRGDHVDVLLGRARFTVDRSDLWTADPAVNPEAIAPGRAPDPPEDPPAEIHLLGRTVDEALGELDRFLDRAVLAGLIEVRVVHGHGTGRLRAAIRAFLDRHAHVSSHRPGRSPEGGDGATVVRLR
jgi:DNA mismatch repair protein MutS2